MLASERLLDRLLTLAQPVEGNIKLVFVNRSKTKRLAEAEGGGERVEHAGGGELGSRRDQPRHNHRDDEVAAAVAGRPEQPIETDVAQRAEHGRHMPVRQRAAHHDGLLIGRRDLSPLEQRAQAFDNVGRPTGQVGDGALLDLAAVPIALPQQEAGGEFRLGTDLIYMASMCHDFPREAILKRHLHGYIFTGKSPITPANPTR